MRLSQRLFKLSCCLATLCFATSAFAQVNMQLTGVNGNSYGGVYTSPYFATVNGVATTVICDDFGTDSYIGEKWTANVSTVSNPTTAKFSASNVQQSTNPTTGFTGLGSLTTQQAYDAVASLATQLLGVSSSSQQAIILSYAIWEVFDFSGVESQLGSTNSVFLAAYADAEAALKSSYTGGEYSNVLIYTSTTGTPQEFISVGTVSTPEAPSPVILAIDLFALGIIVLLFRRRKLGQE